MPADPRPHTLTARGRTTRAGLVGVSVLLALAAVACGSNARPSSDGTTSSSGLTTASTGTTVTVPPGATVEGTFPPGTATITTSSSDLGTILVDGTGHTLYLFVADSPGVPTCTGDCAKAWPPVTGNFLALSNSVPRQAGEFKLVAIPGAAPSKQVAVDGHPLYRFAGDGLAGEMKGQGLDGKWYVVGADGQPITKALPSTTTTR